MPHILPTLPFAFDAFDGLLSPTTIEAHYKLHERYFTKLNKMTQGTPYFQVSLEEIIKTAPEDSDLLFVASQAWNHSFLWQSMSPSGGGSPDPRTGFGRAVQQYGSSQAFQGLILQQSLSLPKPGWTWIVATPQGEVKIWAAEGGQNPLRYDHLPLLNIDLWEHAYYLDYLYEKEAFVQMVLEDVVNWPFASANYQRAFGV